MHAFSTHQQSSFHTMIAELKHLAFLCSSDAVLHLSQPILISSGKPSCTTNRHCRSLHCSSAASYCCSFMFVILHLILLYSISAFIVHCLQITNKDWETHSLTFMRDFCLKRYLHACEHVSIHQ